MFEARNLLGALVGAAITLSPLAASADDGILQARLTPCPAGAPDTNIGDVNACGLSWTLAEGRAQLSANGKILVKVKGLVINDARRPDLVGTPDGVTKVYASLVCGGNADRRVVASTRLFPINVHGDAKILDRIVLPASCIAPAIVVRESDFPAQGWLAATGF